MSEIQNRDPCAECGCPIWTPEMGGFHLQWHYRDCKSWDAYVDAGVKPKAELEHALPSPPENTK